MTDTPIKKDVKISLTASQALDELAALWKRSRKESCELAISSTLTQQKSGTVTPPSNAKLEELLQRLLTAIEQW